LRANDPARTSPLAPVKGYADVPAVSAYCLEALDGAIDLVRADGGEVAALDVTGAFMVTRARRKRAPRPMGFGLPARHSQPITTAPLDDADPIDSQVTQLLPSAQLARTFHPDQGLIGRVWNRREPILERLDPNARGAESMLYVEADAPHHLAVPIFRPDTLGRVTGRGPVIGVLRVFRRDEMWPFSVNDRLLLELHGDRLGRALSQFDTPTGTIRRADLVGALRELSGVEPTLDALLERVSQIATRQLTAVTFAAILQKQNSDEVRFALSLRAGVPQPVGHLHIAELPPSLHRALLGELVNEHAPQPGSPDAMKMLGWTPEQTRSMLAAPLIVSGHREGVITVTSPQVGAFTDDAASLFEAIALATATFAENARLVEDARGSVKQLNTQRLQLSALINAVQTLNASLDIDATLRALAQQASMLTSAEVCAVFLRDEAQQSLVCRAVYPPGREHEAALLQTHIPMSWHNIGTRLDQGAFVMEQGLAASEDAPDSSTAKLARVGLSGFLATPIAQRDRQLGALVVYSPRQSRAFVSDEIGLLQGLSSQAAIALNNAQLYAEIGAAYEQLKELDRLKDDFILTVSHEFRTPLTAIEGYVTLINKHGHKLDQEKLQQFASEIHQATVQLAGMISMLADANRMSTQPLRITPRAINLLAVANDAVGVQPPEAKERIQLRIADDLWVNGDDERLPRVFSNLISNAIKYAGPGKLCRVTARITPRQELVSAGRKLASEETAQEWVTLSVEDDGPGISPEDQTKLFQKFVRLAQSRVTPVRGTGLGLWICRQYVEAMGGDIWVESHVGHGSRFCFCLPRISTPSA
jgi:signal transduction histidine kinase